MQLPGGGVSSQHPVELSPPDEAGARTGACEAPLPLLPAGWPGLLSSGGGVGMCRRAQGGLNPQWAAPHFRRAVPAPHSRGGQVDKTTEPVQLVQDLAQPLSELQQTAKMIAEVGRSGREVWHGGGLGMEGGGSDRCAAHHPCRCSARPGWRST